MKRLCTLVSLLFISCGVFCQALSTITGNVKDDENGEALPLVTVVVKDANDQFAAGTSTNEAGVFELQVAPGQYQVTYSFVGYEIQEQELKLAGDTALIIPLQALALDIEEVVVQGERSTTQYLVDRKVIHVGKDLQSIGGDAGEVLQQLAEVQTTAEGEVMLRGSNNVNILINGKPSPLSSAEVLRQISAQEMVQVELITSPSAKYQADGLTGIINIITKRKNESGWVSSFNGRVNSNGAFNTGVQLNYGSPKLNVGLSGNYGESWNQTQRTRERIGGGSPYSQIGASEFDGLVKSLKGNLDWFIDAKNELSLSLAFTDNSHDIPASVTGQELESPNAWIPFEFSSLNTHQHRTDEYNLNYRTYFAEKDNFLEFDFHFSDNKNALPATFILPGDTSQNNIQYNTRIANWALDLEQPIKSLGAHLEAGVLWTNKNVDNSQDFIANLSNPQVLNTTFSYDENILGTYGLLKKKWAKWQLQLGLRWEWYENGGDFTSTQSFVGQRFQNFFPSAHLNYFYSDKVTFNLAFNRRISRPNLYHINPFTNSNDRFFQRAGNPNLQPEFSQNIEWSARFTDKIWSFTPTLFYRAKTNLLISTYVFSETDQRTFQQFINEGRSDAYGLEGAFAFFPASWTRTTVNANYYLEQLSELENDFGSNRLSRFNLTAKQLFNIGKKWRLDFSWFYWGDTRSRFSFYAARSKLDVAVNVKVLRNKGSIGLRVTDVFDTLEYFNEWLGQDFREESFRKSLTRVAYLNFSYRFEQGKKGKRRNRKKRSFNEPGSRE